MTNYAESYVKRKLTSSAPLLTTQQKQVLNHLKKVGHMTKLEAQHLYRIDQLPARIFELKALGYDIVATILRDATGKRYARYSLKA